MEYKKGWYSICSCNKLDLNIAEEEELTKAITDDSLKYIFLKNLENEIVKRFQIIRKSWVIIESYNTNKGMIKKKVPILRRFFLDYYFKKKIVLFHTGIAKIESIIKYLKKNTQTQILYNQNTNLFSFLRKLSDIKVEYNLLEGMLINYELEGGTMTNLHFKRITQEDRVVLFSQGNAYLSWIKISVVGSKNSFELALYSNGTYYQNKNDPLIFELLNLYLSI